MNNRTKTSSVPGRVLIAFFLIACTTLLNGCAIYDWLCAKIQTAFSSGSEYKVSVVNCKNFPVPDEIIPITPKLSSKLSESIREGVVQVGRMPKFQNITLVDKIPNSESARFYDAMFGTNMEYGVKLAFLRKCAEQYNSNIIIWGATMGDDSKVAFIGYLYRRDLDVVVNTGAKTFEKDMSARVQEELVRNSTVNLVTSSLDDRPIGRSGEIAKDFYEHKEEVLTGVAAILSVALKTYLSPDGD